MLVRNNYRIYFGSNNTFTIIFLEQNFRLQICLIQMNWVFGIISSIIRYEFDGDGINNLISE